MAMAVEHYNDLLDMFRPGRSCSIVRRLAMSCVSFFVFWGIAGEAGVSSLRSHGLVIGASKYFLLRLLETVGMAIAFYAETWGLHDVRADQHYHRTRTSTTFGQNISQRTTEATNSSLSFAGDALAGLPTANTYDALTSDMRSLECESQSLAILLTAAALLVLYVIGPLAYCLDPVGSYSHSQANSRAANRMKLYQPSQTSTFICNRIQSQILTIIAFVGTNIHHAHTQ